MDGTSRAGASADAPARIVVTSYASFILIGWSGLLIPSLLRVIKAEFGQTDAGFGLLYLISALFFAIGALSAGLLAERLGRRVLLPLSALAIAVGLATQGLAPSWPVLLLGVALAGAGSGAIDAGVNSVVMDLSVSGKGSALNRLHLFYSVGALGAPLAIGQLVGLGVNWRLLAAGTGIVALALVVPLRTVGSVPPRRRAATVVPGAAVPGRAGAGGAVSDDRGARANERGTGPDERRVGPDLRLPLAILGVAIACYVATELGVSSWLVGFLDDEPMSVATLGLSLFWVGHASGRLTAVRIADRFDPIRFTTACAIAGSVALAVAVHGPGGAPRIAAFAITGFALGPVWPMIMTVGGTLFPHRAATVSGVLTAAGVVGSVLYPPFMGLISSVAGLGAGMTGAAVLALLSGAAVVTAGRLAARRRVAAAVLPPRWDLRAR
ncbi:MAG: MFS transporter [Chloroflexota bacterium]